MQTVKYIMMMRWYCWWCEAWAVINWNGCTCKLAPWMTTGRHTLSGDKDDDHGDHRGDVGGGGGDTRLAPWMTTRHHTLSGDKDDYRDEDRFPSWDFPSSFLGIPRDAYMSKLRLLSGEASLRRATSPPEFSAHPCLPLCLSPNWASRH